jgi:hypothetical protein
MEPTKQATQRRQQGGAPNKNARAHHANGRFSWLRLKGTPGTARQRSGQTFKHKIGRRDWTRTNDPHHVKVVL